LHDRDCEVGSDTRLRYCTAPQVHRPGRLQTSTDVYRSLPTSTTDVYRCLQTSTTDVYRCLQTSTPDFYRSVPTTLSRMCSKVFSPAPVCHSDIVEVCSYFLSCRNALATYPEGNLYPSPPHIVTNISVVWSRLKRKHDDSRRDATGLTSRYPGSVYPYFSDSSLAEKNAIYTLATQTLRRSRF